MNKRNMKKSNNNSIIIGAILRNKMEIVATSSIATSTTPATT